ncbi:MAG: hypothetical protein ABSC42_10880 [Tepidisphaeraceae bacterium]|jgi:hypothetical protein
MPRLWVRRDLQQWTTVPLDHDPFELNADPLGAIVPTARDGPVVLARKVDDGKDQWALIVRPGEEAIVHVNGDRVMLGMRALRDHDAIQIGGGGRIYFSAESAPVIVTYPEGKPPVICPRCSTEIKSGDLVVRCPKCETYFHQKQELECWLYDDRCQCDQPTALSEENCWRPDEYSNE